ncbi:TPA: hypothetical protein RQL08_004333 [Vibrio vulnificus]|nr:hypothetical protein [Vibrio cholerae]HDY8132513.1 hypothetical protein [Vibrio vulnificus]HDY8137048.1 hypothetical protein [Vibrio vulnificus]HDY8150546.1 hypothetical protein [Vibrio vulnificus]HDY8155100.1 hypothetical protein [Vibrio vulnificus]
MPLFDKNKIPLVGHHAKIAKFSNKFFEKNDLCLLSCVGCNSVPINSHSLQEAAIRRIADKTSHVYAFQSPSFDELNAIYSEAKYSPKKISSSNATTFKGFCLSHDTKLFECIEKEKIIPTEKQLHALHLRAIAKLVFNFSAGMNALEGILNYDYPDYHNPKEELLFLLREKEPRLIVRDRLMQETEDVIRSIDCSGTKMKSYLILRLTDVPSIMCSTIFIPSFDFNGNPLPVHDNLVDAPYICVTVSSDIYGGYIVLQWDKQNIMSQKVISSLHENGLDTNKLLAMSILFSDYIFKIDWWDTLGSDQKEMITHFAMSQYFMYWLRDPDVPRKMYNHFFSKNVKFSDFVVDEIKTNA